MHLQAMDSTTASSCSRRRLLRCLLFCSFLLHRALPACALTELHPEPRVEHTVSSSKPQVPSEPRCQPDPEPQQPYACPEQKDKPDTEPQLQPRIHSRSKPYSEPSLRLQSELPRLPEKKRPSEWRFLEDHTTPEPLTNRSGDFPQDFVFGTASAAYQYEGAAAEGGRGPSIWDTWSHSRGKTTNGDTGDVAVDQYHRYQEDVQLMKAVSLDAYRFSISWSRIYPNGTDPLNQEGVDYYNNLIDELLANGIQPFVTLFHWDLPQGIEDAYQGWLSSQTVVAFSAYADTCFRLFGDRVKHWITFNEPHSFVPSGYDNGMGPPGRCSRCQQGNSATEPYIAAHNVLLSHAAAYRVYESTYKGYQGGQVGITLDTTWYEPLNVSSTADAEAVERAILFQLGWYLDPLFFGGYPTVMQDAAQDRLPQFSDKERHAVAGSYDFIGINHYTSAYAFHSHSAKGAVVSYSNDQNVGTTALPFHNASSWLVWAAERGGHPIGIRGASGWLYIVPYGIERMLRWVNNRYNCPPIYITENGFSDSSSLSKAAALNDTLRQSYMQSYLPYVARVVREGGDVRGYFTWSLLDNFEWGSGYTIRFGLHYVDYQNNLERTPKDSAVWFGKYLSRSGQ